MESTGLISNFSDYYDKCWNNFNIPFRRINSEGPNRHDAFRLLRKMGIKVPVFGKAKYIKEKIDEFYGGHGMKADEADNLVIYLNENTHNKESKTFLSLQDAIDKFPGHLSSMHIPCKLPDKGNVRSITHRHLHIGKQFIWLRYSSDDKWRSNVGNVKIEVLKVDYVEPKFERALYAIDYVYAPDENLYAIDYNISPKLQGTGIENILEPKEVCKLIQSRLRC